MFILEFPVSVEQSVLMQNAVGKAFESASGLFYSALLFMAAVWVIGTLLKNPGALVEFIVGIFELIGIIIIGILKLITWPFRDHEQVTFPVELPYNKEPSIKPNSPIITQKMITDMEWFSFEKLTKQYLLSSGFKASLTNFGADGGIDLVIEKKDGRHAYVQCKAFGSKNVGVKFIREFYGVMCADNVTEGYFVTSGSYTMDAKAFAADKPIKLVTGNDLLVKINELPYDLKYGIFNDIFSDHNYKTPTCPNCALKMVLRTNRRTGKFFWGCPTFPKCRNKMPVSKRK